MENEASIKSRRLAVLLFMSERDDLNRKTLDSLLAQDIREDVGYIVFAPSEKDYLKSFAADKGGVFYISSGSISKDFNRANKLVSRKGLVTFMEAGDTFGRNYLSKMVMRATSKSPRIGDYYMVSMPAKISSVNGEYDIFAKKPAKKKFYKSIVPNREIRFDTMFSTIPRMLRGTWIRGDYFTTHDMDETAVYDAEKAYLYDLAVSSNIMMFSQDTDYSFAGVTDADFRLFQPFYEREFYYDDLNVFWVPYLQKYKKKGRIPTIIQHMAFYELCTRTEANTNNRNKHVVPEEEAYDYLKSWKPVLDLLEDDVILNTYNQAYIRKHPCVHRLMLKIKYDDEDLRYDLYYFKNKFYYGKQNLLVNMMSSQSVDIIYMECKDGVLHLDCEVSDLYFNGKGDFGVELNDVPVPYKLTERYAHTKLFGKSIYKRLAFEADVKLEDVNEQRIRFVYNNEHGRMVIPITFGSHTSKLSKRFRNCYWCFRSDDLNFMAIHNQNSILVKKAGRLSRFKKEQRLRFEMFFKGFRDKKAFIFWLVRLAYFFFKPFMKKRPIWLFFDKIYKGGDSAEYIYKYSCAQDDGIDKYYLIDRKAADYKRLKAEGYKPLVRGSIKHRLIFLYSDLVIVSNSTVFEFNDYSIQTSSYIRDLVDFSVACVQHGMSIQKIAVAQNRLRDNTRLYFCASNYEIENLNRPVYDYAGRDILKLTGVPRYDGLKDCDKKQILISPTWRMQAALAPNGNEGVEREYNPLFKESDYYKIYNSLINDEMLIAAAEKYGYKILYVLHPIVSPQLRDFDRNEFVEIVPSVGDFSYEKAFCESSLMVTDYSGVQFDFAYMRKPVLYLHHKDMPTHYEEGTYHYDTMSFGEICHDNKELVELLIEYMKNGCKMKDEYVRRADDFFVYKDNDNCSRIYPEMLKFTRANEKKTEKTSLFSEIERYKLEGTFFAHIFRTNNPKYKNQDFKKKVKGWDMNMAMKKRAKKYRNTPIQKDKIFFMTYDSNYICNPRYIADEILRRGLPYDLVWGIPNVGRIRKELYPEGIRLVRRGTVQMFRELASSRIWIDNALEFFIYGVPKREGQIYMNTWHGSLGIKKLSGDDVWLERASKCNKYTDFCITNSGFEENVFRTTFWQDTPFLKYGHARNDILFDEEGTRKLKDRLFETYGLEEGTKVFLYAPTFREEGMAGYEDIDYGALRDALKEKFGGDWVILVRWHHKERKFRKVPKGKKWLIDASEYGDMQELLPAIDIGMSDYSSWVYDFILTGRPIFLYAPDIAEYDQARGFYYPIDSTPFPIAGNNAELVKNVSGFDMKKYEQGVKDFLEDKGCYEKGNAAKLIVDKIEEIIQGG